MNAAIEPTRQLRDLALDAPVPPQPDWLQESRSRAVQRLQAAKLPDRADENWRYTSLEPILRHDFRSAGPAPGDRKSVV